MLAAILLLGPWLPPQPGGLGFFGPTDPEVPAIWWNAAALGELGGTHLHLSGSPVFERQQITLDGAATVDNGDLQPDFFFGASTDFTTEHVRVGLAWHIPFREQGSFPGANTPTIADDGPQRYHRVETSILNHYISPVAAFRINSSVSFGIGTNIVWSDARMALDRDRPLDCGTSGMASCPGVAMAGLSNPAFAERVDMNGTALSVGAQAGFLWNILGRVTLGGAFISRSAGLSRSTIFADRYDTREQNATVRRADGSLIASGYGQINYALPDVVHFGARWLVTDRLEAAATFRYVDWGQRSQAIRLRMTSQQLRAANEPEEIVLYRGYADSYGLWARGAYCARPSEHAASRCRVRLGLLAGFDTGQYARDSVNADALDGPSLQLGAVFEWRIARHLRIMGGGSWTAMTTQRVTNSLYNPAFAVGCVDSGYQQAACAAATAGRGLPSASGSYGLQSYTASLAVALDWWAR